MASSSAPIKTVLNKALSRVCNANLRASETHGAGEAIRYEEMNTTTRSDATIRHADALRAAHITTTNSTIVSDAFISLLYL